MSIPENLREKFYNALELYDEDKYYANFKRKAYDDDCVLIKIGVRLNDIIVAFDLKNREFYKKYLKDCEKKNNHKIINANISKKEPYIIYTLKYYISAYDFGCEKYNALYIEELKETYAYDKSTNKYSRYLYSSGGNLTKYYLTYIDLIDNTYKTVKSVVKKIKDLEKKIPVDYDNYED